MRHCPRSKLWTAKRISPWKPRPRPSETVRPPITTACPPDVPMLWHISINFSGKSGGHAVVTGGRTVIDGRGRCFHGRGYSETNQTCTYYILMTKSALKHSWKKINNVPVVVSIFFSYFWKWHVLSNLPPPPEPTHHIREFLSYGANSFCSS